MSGASRGAGWKLEIMENLGHLTGLVDLRESEIGEERAGSFRRD